MGLGSMCQVLKKPKLYEVGSGLQAPKSKGFCLSISGYKVFEPFGIIPLSCKRCLEVLGTAAVERAEAGDGKLQVSRCPKLQTLSAPAPPFHSLNPKPLHLTP